VVGEVLGDGITFTSSTVSALNPATICLDLNVNINQDLTSFPVMDFAVGTSTTVGQPMGLSGITPANMPSQTPWCGQVTASGTYYPIIRSSTYLTDTPSNSATGQAPVVLTVIAAVVLALAAVRTA